MKVYSLKLYQLTHWKNLPVPLEICLCVPVEKTNKHLFQIISKLGTLCIYIVLFPPTPQKEKDHLANGANILDYTFISTVFISSLSS